jgi:hypothetical protein
MKLRRAISVLAGIAGATLTAGALVAGPASAAPAPTVTTLTLSAARITFGHEGSEVLTFQVASGNAQSPTGAVTVTTGPFVICASALSKNGTGTCTMSDSQLAPGIYQLIATYRGDADNAGSTSTAQRLTVLPTPLPTP